MKPTLDCHEIMIVHNDAHDDSFVCVPQNKVAFSVCGWNPMNQNVLYLPEVIGKIINKNIKEDTMASYIARSGQ